MYGKAESGKRLLLKVVWLILLKLMSDSKSSYLKFSLIMFV